MYLLYRTVLFRYIQEHRSVDIQGGRGIIYTYLSEWEYIPHVIDRISPDDLLLW